MKKINYLLGFISVLVLVWSNFFVDVSNSSRRVIEIADSAWLLSASIILSSMIILLILRTFRRFWSISLYAVVIVAPILLSLVPSTCGTLVCIHRNLMAQTISLGFIVFSLIYALVTRKKEVVTVK